MEDDDESKVAVENRLWRAESRLTDARARLDRIESRVDSIERGVESRKYLIEALSQKIADLEKRPAAGGTGFFGESTIVRIVVYGLMALVTSLAIGKAFVFPLTGAGG